MRRETEEQGLPPAIGNCGALWEKEVSGEWGLPDQEDVYRQESASLEGVQYEQRDLGNREHPGASTHLGIPR